MANLKASKKDVRKSRRRRIANVAQLSVMRTLYKKILKLAIDGKTDEAKVFFRKYGSHLDKMGRKHIIHPSQANRRKSRAALLVNKVTG